MALAEVDRRGTSCDDTVTPAGRRDTVGSTSSDDDIGAIREMDINVEGQEQSGGGGTGAKTMTGLDSSTAKLSSLRSLLGIPPSGGQRAGQSLLGVPPSTSARTAPPGIGGAGAASLNVGGGVGEDGRAMLKSEIAPKRKKVVLEPGCSALDWAVKKTQMAEERSRRPDGMRMQRITPTQLKTHNTRQDAWSAFNGKVYDVTAYLRFHPGGQQELMRVAGRDGTRLFMLTHSWVNIDAMIDACCVGILVSET